MHRFEMFAFTQGLHYTVQNSVALRERHIRSA